MKLYPEPIDLVKTSSKKVTLLVFTNVFLLFRNALLPF